MLMKFKFSLLRWLEKLLRMLGGGSGIFLTSFTFLGSLRLTFAVITIDHIN